MNRNVRCGALVVVACILPAASASAQALPDPRLSNPVEVGTSGNEPLIYASSDGVLYISALQYLYRSRDRGRTWTALVGPLLTGTVLASDSSIWVAPEGRLYFSFDYPYAGQTAACTSDDQGDTFSCASAALPGVTDRMWIYAPTQNDAYLTTNEGLYQTTLAVSHDGGQTYVPYQFGGEPLQPQTGPLLAVPGSANLLQAIKLDTQSLYVFSESLTPTMPTTQTRTSGLGNTNAILSLALSKDNKLFLVGEEPNPLGGKQLIPAYSSDEGLTWTRLPPIPQTTTGSATFSWIAAGKAGHVGVLYYYSTSNVDATVATDAVWTAEWAETSNAFDAVPTWQVFPLEKVHTGAICAAADCMGTARFSGDFINATFDADDNAHLTWEMEDASAATHVRYAQVSAPVPGGTTTGTTTGSTTGATTGTTTGSSTGATTGSSTGSTTGTTTGSSTGSTSGSSTGSTSGATTGSTTGSTTGVSTGTTTGTPVTGSTTGSDSKDSGRLGGGAFDGELILMLIALAGLRRPRRSRGR